MVVNAKPIFSCCERILSKAPRVGGQRAKETFTINVVQQVNQTKLVRKSSSLNASQVLISRARVYN
jgi:hypothetical protein